jgi:HEAT repeat protein
MSPSNLPELIKKPDLARIEAWKHITGGSTLYETLLEAVQTNTVGPALEYMEEWRSFAEYRQEERRRWEAAYKLVRCAEQAASYRGAFGDGLDRGTVLPPHSSAASYEEGTSRLYVNTFINPSPIRSVQLPIAGWSLTGGGEGVGFTATLILELLPGNGYVAQHPADLFSTVADELFREAIEAAWTAAKAHAREPDVTPYDGRWRVVQDGYPLVTANGSSAGAAAALGWLHALDSTAIDEGMIVLAQVDKSGKFREVDGVREKVSAVVESRDFDTILVAGDKNRYEALQALQQKEIKHNSVQVVAVKDLPSTYEKRSRLTDELIGYCRKLADELDWVPWLSPSGEGVKVSDIAVPVRVHMLREHTFSQKAEVKIVGASAAQEFADIAEQTFNSDKTPDSSFPSEQEIETVPHSPKRRAAPVGRQHTTVARDDVLFKQYESETYEEGLVKSRGGQPWEEVWPQRGDLIVIRAKPGGGKTVHTRQIVVKAARELADRLERRKVGLSKADRIPVWLTVTTIADPSLPSDTEAAIAGAIERQYNTLQLSPDLRNYLKRALSERAWLIFDGLDELYDAEQLSRVARHFSAIRNWFSPCCVTCRTGNYEKETLARDRVVEYELAPFRWNGTKTPDNEIRHFVLKWFSSDSQKGAELLRILEQNFALRHQCGSPLLLTLTCLAHQDSSQITQWTTHADLFSLVLNGLLGGKWRSRALSRGQQNDTGSLERENARQDLERQAFNGLTIEGSRIEFAQDMLPHLAYQLIGKGGLRNRFLSSEVIEAMTLVPKTCRTNEPRFMIEWLLYKGILVNAGYETGRICYSFVHRALLEYLIAQELKNQPDYINTVMSGLVDSNELTANAWWAIVPPLVGSVKEPTPLIELLVAANRDDHLRKHWGLLSSAILTCLLESKTALSDATVRARAFDAILMHVDYAQRNSKGNTWRVLQSRDILHMALDAARKHYGDDQETRAVWEAVDAVWRNRPDPPEQKQAFINTLNEALDVDVPPARWAALWALVQATKENGAAAAVRRLSDESPVVRGLAMRALVVARVDNAFELLVQSLADDNDPYARGCAAHALGELGDKKAIPYLKPYALEEDVADSITREPVMWALATLATKKSEGLADIFCSGLGDSVDKIRKHAVLGLVNSASQKDSVLLIDRVRNDSSNNVRQQAAWALGMLEVREDDAIECLIEGMTDKEPYVAAACCRALMKYALDQAYPHVLLMLARADEDQKRRLLYGLKETVRVNHRNKKLRPKYYASTAELSLKLFDDQSEQVKVLAAWTLTSVMRLLSLNSDAVLTQRLLAAALKLCDDHSPRTRMSGCSLLIELSRVNTSSLVKERGDSKQALMKAVSLLNDPDLIVRRKACQFLLEVAQAGAKFLLENGRMCERIIEAGLESFRESTPRQKADTLEAFRHLFRSPRMLTHRRLRGEVMAWCLELIETDSPEMQMVSLLMLKTLMYGTFHPAEEQNVSLIIETCFELLSGPASLLKANALSLLAVIFTLPQYEGNQSGRGALVKESLRLTYDETVETRTSACWSLSQIAGARPEALTMDRTVATLVINRLTELLSDPTPEVKAYALLAFKHLAATSLLTDDTWRLRLIANQAARMLKDKSDKVKSYALWALEDLIQAPVLRGNRHACNSLAAACRQMLSNKKPVVRTNALRLLGILAPKDTQHEGEQQQHDATRERLISLIDHRHARIRERALQDLVNLMKQDSSLLAADPRFIRIVADRSLRMLKGSSTSVQITVLMVLEQIFTKTAVKHEAAIRHQLLERCLTLLDSREPTLTAAALRTLERLMIEADLKLEDELRERFYAKNLRLLEGQSSMVRTTALGIFIALDKSGLLTQTLSEEVAEGLVRRCLSMLGEIDKGMQASALMVLEQILTKTSLRSDVVLVREVAEQCLALLGDAEAEVKSAALRTVETLVLQTQLRGDAQLVCEWLAHSLSLMNDFSLQVRLTACGDISSIVTEHLLPVTADGKLESSVIKTLISALNDGDAQIISSACLNLSKLLGRKWQPLLSDQEAFQEAAARCAELIKEPRLTARVGAAWLLLGIINIRKPVLDAETTLAVAKRSLELLADVSPKVRSPASAILARLVIRKFDLLISDEYLVRQMFDRAKSLLRDADSMVKANAFKILQVFTHMPEHEKHALAHHRLAVGALKALSAPESHVRIGACTLLIEMIKSRLKVFIEDDDLIRSFSKRCAELMLAPSSATRETVCVALTEMTSAGLQAFVADAELVSQVAERCVELQGGNSSKVAAKAKTLLLNIQASNLAEAVRVAET